MNTKSGNTVTAAEFPTATEVESVDNPSSAKLLESVKKSPPSVLILVQTATDWHRRIVEGVASYVSEQGPWYVHIEPRGLYEKLSIPKGWRGDGIIARFDHKALADQVKALGVPAVNVSWSQATTVDIPCVFADEYASGRLAAEHFLDNAFRNFGYVGPIDRPDYHEDRLLEAFRERLAESGYMSTTYHPPEKKTPLGWHDQIVHLTAWLDRQPKPLAVFTWSDARSRELVEACWEGGYKVPEDVAIISSEQEANMSLFAGIELSSVNLAPQRVGYEAAATLDQMMQGKPVASMHKRIPALGVTVRQSSDYVAVEDPFVSEALGVIRERYQDPITVEDLLQICRLSRRTLEKHFKAELGRTPADELRRVRLERAKQLLRDTDLTVEEISTRCGFLYANTLTRNLREQIGLTPTAFRNMK